MEQAIQLFGFLILTFLGVISPILVILLSMFREGALKLTEQYENEKAQSEQNIKEQFKKLNKQLKKIGKIKKADEKEMKDKLKKVKTMGKIVKNSLREVKTIKKTAEIKLSYLNPKKQILRLFTPLLISFLGVILAILNKANIYWATVFITLSLICFTDALVVLWKLLNIIIEVRKTIDEDKRDMDMKMKTIELLSVVVKKTGKVTQYFLEKVYITIDDKSIKDNEGEITISTIKKQELKIGISNIESLMAKNIEIGFIFPSDFIIEKTSYYSIYTDKTGQIVRYTTPSIHGNTHLILKPLIITPLKKGDYQIRTFIKAENIESTYRNLNFKIKGLSLDEEVSKLVETLSKTAPAKRKGD